MDKINLAVVVTPDRREVLGLTANAPMELVCMALLSQQDPQAPRVHIMLLTEEELAAKTAPPKPVKAAPMSALRGRSDCPVVVKVGPVADMLSILSDSFKGGH